MPRQSFVYAATWTPCGRFVQSRQRQGAAPHCSGVGQALAVDLENIPEMH